MLCLSQLDDNVVWDTLLETTPLVSAEQNAATIEWCRQLYTSIKIQLKLFHFAEAKCTILYAIHMLLCNIQCIILLLFYNLQLINECFPLANPHKKKKMLRVHSCLCIFFVSFLVQNIQNIFKSLSIQISRWCHSLYNIHAYYIRWFRIMKNEREQWY